MAQEQSVQTATDFLDEQVGDRLSNVYAQHGVVSQSRPTIGTSDNPLVSQYFARGPSQTQNGFVMTFRLSPQDAETFAIPNWDNPMSFEMPNPDIGLPEREFLFHSD